MLSHVFASTAFEHHAVLHTLAKLEKEGFEVTYLDVRHNHNITAQQVKDAIRSLLRNCTRITIDVWRGDDLLVGIPLIICVLLFLIAYYIMIPLAIVGLALRCRYHIGGWEEAGAEAINRTMDQVTDTVADWTDQLRSELRSEHDKKKNKKK